MKVRKQYTEFSFLLSKSKTSLIRRWTIEQSYIITKNGGAETFRPNEVIQCVFVSVFSHQKDVKTFPIIFVKKVVVHVSNF